MADKPKFQRTRRLFGRGKNYAKEVVNVEEVSSNWDYIKSMAAGVLKPGSGNHREETFNNAMARMNLSEADIASSYKYHVVRVYIFGVGLLIGVGGLLFSLINQRWFGSIGYVGFCAAMGALAFQASFRAYQIHRRELVDVAFWAQHPAEWIPRSMTLAPRKKSNLPVVRSSSSTRKPK